MSRGYRKIGSLRRWRRFARSVPGSGECLGAQKYGSGGMRELFSMRANMSYPPVESSPGRETVGDARKDGRLTTHVLDTARGTPAADMAIELFAVKGAAFELILTARTNADGRCDAPLLSGGSLKPGEYELRFHAGDYLDKQAKAEGRRFLDIIPIRFGIEDERAHTHVPLLVAPYGYSTYRGS
jgi:5-hydroxyisourate hydrolase